MSSPSPSSSTATTLSTPQNNASQESTNDDDNNNNKHDDGRLLGLLKDILAQDRSVLNYVHYTPSPEHHARMTQLLQAAPHLYDNPQVTPRSEWFRHPRWHQNSQMPPFHVHYRQEMQTVLKLLLHAHDSLDGEVGGGGQQQQQQQAAAARALRNAQVDFIASMRDLTGHVSIEEYTCFPLYEQAYPQVNIGFLYQDHKDLHAAENRVRQAMDQLLSGGGGGVMAGSTALVVSRRDVLAVIDKMLEFDAQLMNRRAHVLDGQEN